jgi:hypothetical protein
VYIFNAAGGLALYDTNNPGGSTVTAYQMTIGATYLVTERRDLTTYGCVADNAGTTATLAKTVALTNTPYTASLRIEGATVRFHWLMVVTNP